MQKERVADVCIVCQDKDKILKMNGDQVRDQIRWHQQHTVKKDDNPKLTMKGKKQEMVERLLSYMTRKGLLAAAE